MPGPLHITLIALLASCDAFTLGPFQHASPPVARLLRDEGRAHTQHVVQELVRTKRVQELAELVRAQPHLVHDMGSPEIHETTRTKAKMDAANSSKLDLRSPDRPRSHSAVEENRDVEEEMERMVHLVVPQDAETYGGQTGPADPEKELLGGPGAGDTSLEASGFYGTDMEDRDRGEDRERRGGDATAEEEEEDDQDIHLLDPLEANHTTPDLDALIGYSPSFHASSPRTPGLPFPTEEHDSGPQEHRASPVLEVGPLERELWESEGEGRSSGYGLLHSSITTTSTTTSTATTTTTTTTAGEDTVGTSPPETDTGTDFGLLGTYTKDETEEEQHGEEEEEEEEEQAGLVHKGTFTQNPTVPDVGLAPSREPLQPSVEEEEDELEQGRLGFKGFGPEDRSEEDDRWRKTDRVDTRVRHIIPLTTDPPTTSVRFTDPSWEWLEKTTRPSARRSEVRGGKVAVVTLPDPDLHESEKARQVMCINWSELAGRGYVLLNMTKNMNCEEFRVDQGVRLLKVLERVFARRLNSPEGSWLLYLSKPTHQQHQLVMNVASQNGVIPTNEVLGMLGEIRESLIKVGIQNYSAASSCSSRPSQTRSDYGKLFVVLVIIGSICMVIITSGFIYICWQRRLPATKTNFRAEELHFVENGCHDNPTLDVGNDSQPEMEEKKPSTNGLAGGGEGGGQDGKRWQVFVNQAATEEEEEEQDTHL